MKNVLTIQHQINGFDISLCYGDKAYSKYLKKYHNLDMQLNNDGRTPILPHDKFGFAIVVGIKHIDNIYQLKGLIVHEISHVVSEIMEHYQYNCDEFRAYTTQFLYIEFMKFIDEILND